MFNLKPELIENEMVLGEYGATVYMVRGNISSQGSNIRLWLTDRRLILKAALGPQRTLALHDMVDVREQKVVLYTMVRIEFISGHLEWFTVENQAQFIQVLETARLKAPVVSDVSPLPQTAPLSMGSIPAAPAGPQTASSGERKALVIAVVTVAVMLVLCLFLLTLMGGAFYLYTHH